MKKLAAITLTSALVSSLTFSTAFAFSDVEDAQKEAITALQNRGVVSGIDNEHFAPKGQISFAQSLQMIVKGLDLNLDAIRFANKPTASGIYTHVADDAWYADAFIIAYYNGLDIPKDVDPNAVMSREQFGDLLVRALEKKGNFPLVKMYIEIKDADQITVQYQGALQRLLLYKIATLDQEGKLYPKAALTRGEAAAWVYNASKVVEAHQQKPVPAEEIAVSVEPVNDAVNKVTLSRGPKPSAGYAIAVTDIQFGQDGQAVIHYTLQDPQPDAMNASVVTEPKADVYISSAYKVTAEPAAGQ